MLSWPNDYYHWLIDLAGDWGGNALVGLSIAAALWVLLGLGNFTAAVATGFMRGWRSGTQ